MSTLTYLKSFFRDKNVASVTPSSNRCVRRLCRHIDFSQPRVVIEYGAGTGVFTRYLLKQMADASQLIAFETNDKLVGKLQQIDDTRLRIHHDSVEYVEMLEGDAFGGKVDAIISGIPFSFLDETAKKDVLEQSLRMLRPGGLFLAYQTSGHLEEDLEHYFAKVETEWEWFNLPPMMQYKATKALES